jgi:hypothetical protein
MRRTFLDINFTIKIPANHPNEQLDLPYIISSEYPQSDTLHIKIPKSN